MANPGQHTYHEITSQTEGWAAALRAAEVALPAVLKAVRSVQDRTLLFTGCGSTYYLSQAAAALAREYGLVAVASPASEIWLGPRSAGPALKRSALVALSRSGETSETVRAAEAYRRAGGRVVIVVTCYPDSALALGADVVIAIPSAQELSVAQTRSFASMLVAVQVLTAWLAGDEVAAGRMASLPALGLRLMADYGQLAAQLGGDLAIERFFFLGNGVCYGLAQEAMLKMKEMSLSASEAYHVLEFRHGPKSMVDRSTLVVGLLGDGARAEEAAVLGEMHALGGRVLALTDDGAAAPCNYEASGNPDFCVSLGSGLPPAERAVLYLPFLQLLAYRRAIAKGLDPDQPRNLTAAILL